MADLPERLPHVPLLYAWRELKSAEQKSILGLWGVLVLLGGAWLLGLYLPEETAADWRIDMQSQVEMAAIDSLHTPLRTLPLFAPIAQPILSWTPLPMETPTWSLLVLGLGLLVGWAALFTAACLARSWVSWVVLLVGLMGLFFSDLAHALSISDPFYLLQLAPVLLAALPFALVKLKRLPAQPVWLFVLHLVFFALLTLTLVGAKGLTGLHTWSTGSLPVTLVLLLGASLWVGKTATNAILLLTTNAAQPWRRRPFLQILLLLVAAQLVLLSLSLQALGVSNASWGPVSLAALLPLAWIFTPLLSQNAAKPLERFFPTPLALTLLLLGVGILALGTGQFLFVGQESLFSKQLNRWLAIGFSGVGLAYLAYVLLNFLPLLRTSQNLYFLLHTAPRFSIHLVIGVALGLVILDESLSAWRGVNRMQAVYINQSADNHMLQNQPREAARRYTWALNLNALNNKAGYQLAMLAQPTSPDEVFEFQSLLDMDWSQQANGRVGAKAAQVALNQADTMLALGWLKRFEANPYTQTILAQLTAEVLPDTALSLFKEAIDKKPDEGAFYAEMARVYLSHNQPEPVQAILQAGLKENNQSPELLQMAAYCQLKYPDMDLGIVPETLHDSRSPYNQVALQLQAGTGKSVRDYYEKRGEHPARALHLQTAALLESPKTPETWLAESLAEKEDTLASYAWYNAAVQAYRLGNKEVAAAYARQSGQAGLPLGAFLSNAFKAEAGRHFLVADSLAIQRFELPEPYNELAAKEYLVLQAAHEVLFGQLPFIPTNQELLRLGVYAGQAAKPELASSWYTQLVEQSPDNPWPYYYLGEIFNEAYGPQDALYQVEAGLEKFPENRPLKLAQAAYQLDLGKLDTVQKQVTAWKESGWDTLPIKVLEVRLLRQEGQQEAAFQKAVELAKERPYSLELHRLIGELALLQKSPVDGVNPLVDALNYNPYRPELWRTYAQLAEATSFLDDADNAWSQAANTAYSEAETAAFIDSLEAFRQRNYFGQETP